MTIETKPHGAGKSSFQFIDTDRLFSALDVKSDCRFLDLACGKGLYTLAASERIGEEGQLYAIDLWQEGIALLREDAADKGIHNLQTIVSDAAKPLPLDDGSIDVCLLGTVFHDFVMAQIDDIVLKEIARVLQPQGRLGIVEFKKIDGPPGPPIAHKLDPEDVERRVTPSGFRKELVNELGPKTYVETFLLGV